MSYYRRSDGRLLVRVPLPQEVVDRATEIAEGSGRGLADVLGDLAVAELPEILYEAATELLAPQIATPPALTEGATRRQTDEDPVDPSISPAGVGSELNASGHGIET
jgi:hypothetical protein